MKKLILSFFLFGTLFSGAQNQQIGFSLSNQVTSIPVAGFPQLFTSMPHPGVDLHYGRQLNQKQKNQFWYSGEVSVFYHRFFQTACKLNAGISYRYYFSKQFNAILGIDGGYLHSFYRYNLFELNSSGNYEQVSIIKSRAQFNVGLSAGVSYGIQKEDPNKYRLFLLFKSFTQGLFAGSYIPLVPYNCISIGMSMSLPSKPNSHEK